MYIESYARMPLHKHNALTLHWPREIYVQWCVWVYRFLFGMILGHVRSTDTLVASSLPDCSPCSRARVQLSLWYTADNPENRSCVCQWKCVMILASLAPHWYQIVVLDTESTFNWHVGDRSHRDHGYHDAGDRRSYHTTEVCLPPGESSFLD